MIICDHGSVSLWVEALIFTIGFFRYFQAEGTRDFRPLQKDIMNDYLLTNLKVLMKETSNLETMIQNKLFIKKQKIPIKEGEIRYRK